MINAFETHLRDKFPELVHAPFLLACSGGVDSVVLAHLLHRMKLPFSMAHCNFQLRGNESDADAEFVRYLAQKINVKYFVKRFETEEYVLLNKVSIQEGARILRYRWFDKICTENKLEYIVTAHHADDALETFMFHLSRGAGLNGLTGIPQRNNRILRPLLPFTKETITEFALKEDISWRNDRSNEDTSYFRNKIRHELLPQFTELHPAFLENFRKSIGLLRGSHEMLTEYVTERRKQLELKEGNQTKYPIAGLLDLHPVEAWCYHIFCEYGFTDWESITGLITGPTGKMVVSPTHQLLKDREYLILRPLEERASDLFEIDEGSAEIAIPISLKISEEKAMGTLSPNILYIDKETLNGRLHVRKWQKGDYFYPLGMNGRKLVSKFFKDLKLSRFEKEEQWILCAGEQIVWIIGLRADDRFKVRPGTNNIIKIEYFK